MLEWLLTACAMAGIGNIVTTLDRRKAKKELQNRPSYEPPKKPVRYQNKCKQMMYEVYLKDLKENPEWAAFKVRHGNYGGFVFDDTEY